MPQYLVLHVFSLIQKREFKSILFRAGSMSAVSATLTRSATEIEAQVNMSTGNPLNGKQSAQISEPLIGATKISIHQSISPASVEDWGSKGSSRTPHCSRGGAIPCRCLDWAPEASNKSAWRALSITNVALFIVVIGVNGLLGATDVLKSAGGFSIGEQSNRYGSMRISV